MKNKLISYGPCQIPTLHFVWEREKQIKEFRSRKYNQIVFSLSHNNTTVGPFHTISADMKIFEEQYSEYKDILKNNSVKVNNVLIGQI